MHKITLLQDDMRKILDLKIWSQGTPLGSLGSGSQADMHLGFSRLQFLVVWGPHEHPELLALQGQAKNLKATAA